MATVKTKFKDLKAGDRFLFLDRDNIWLKLPGETYRLLDMSSWPFKTMQRLGDPEAEVKLHDKQFVHPMNIEAPF